MSKKHRPSYADLVEALGEAKALELSKARGGRGLYVPAPGRLGPSTPVVQLLGVDAAEALSGRYGGTTIEIPMTQGKRARVWELREAGRTVPQIAREMLCHERTVYNILAGERPRSLAAREDEPPPLLAFMARR